MVKVKICGLTRHEDVWAAIEAGADAIGLVRHPASPRFVPDEFVQEVVREVGPFVPVVEVFVGFEGSASPSTVIQAYKAPVHIKRRFIQVHHLGEPLSENPPQTYLIDASVNGLHGGTGVTVDWHVAAAFVKEFPQTILAGGLTPDNVAEAIQIVRPYAVDVASGVEASPGVKDLAKVRDFISAVRGSIL